MRLAIGQHLLLANVDKPRPVLIARLDASGRLLLPPSHRVPTAATLEATPEEIVRAEQSPLVVELAPYSGVRREAPVAFVFDLITIPEHPRPTRQN